MDYPTIPSRFKENLISKLQLMGFFVFPFFFNIRVSYMRDQKIMTHQPNLACHQFLYSLQKLRMVFTLF